MRSASRCSWAIRRSPADQAVSFTDAPLLQGRNFSYLDTQLRRPLPQV
jgi:catalase